MADDEGADWMSAADEPEATPAAEGEEAVKTDDAAEEGVAEEDDEDEEEEEKPSRPVREKAERRLLFRHWNRPVVLQYSYLYDYRHNYYDDVIDYLDKRQRGLIREIPRAQTWAERALRTFTNKVRHTDTYHKREKDIDLLSNIRTSGRFYSYHSRDYITTKYSKFLLG